MKKINIAIDGHSSCGKSTTSRLLAARLQYKYIDTGAMYRAVTWYFLDRGIPLNDLEAVGSALDEIRLDFRITRDSGNTVTLNGQSMESRIRTPVISAHVSEVSVISEIRRKLVRQQQEIASRKGVVMDGRDIGTVVLPDAELKIFMTASLEVRTERRFRELTARGQKVSRKEIRENLQHRDHVDSNREDSPLRQADDAILLDTSGLTIPEQTDRIYDLAMERIGRT